MAWRSFGEISGRIVDLLSKGKAIEDAAVKLCGPARVAEHLAGRVVYLAAPYRHPKPFMMAQRTHAATTAAGALILHGVHVYSPLSHGDPVDLALGRGRVSDDAWIAHGLAMLSKCDAVAVLMLRGWDQSAGVALELNEADRRKIPVFFLDPKLWIPASVVEILEVI